MEVKYACRVRSCQKEERRPANNCEKLSGELEGNCSGYLSAGLSAAAAADCCWTMRAVSEWIKDGKGHEKKSLLPDPEIGFKFRVLGGENCLE